MNKEFMRKRFKSVIIAMLFNSLLFVGCDKDEYPPVVLNGVTIDEGRIVRNGAGEPVEIYMHELNLSDSNCLNGIDAYKASLKVLSLRRNHLSSINLSPLSTCVNISWLNLSDNQLTAIDLSQLSACAGLEQLYLNQNSLTSIDLSPISPFAYLESLSLNDNELDSLSCIQVCSFIASHSDCIITTDCVCE